MLKLALGTVDSLKVAVGSWELTESASASSAH